jgi:hypothetical protein
LTTAACSGLRPEPDSRPRRTYLHLSYSCASPCGPAITRDTRPSADFGLGIELCHPVDTTIPIWVSFGFGTTPGRSPPLPERIRSGARKHNTGVAPRRKGAASQPRHARSPRMKPSTKSGCALAPVRAESPQPIIGRRFCERNSPGDPRGLGRAKLCPSSRRFVGVRSGRQD